jgi:pyruvate dehydrogenase E2 component (dihydrolipoamide acetyltransferase)
MAEYIIMPKLGFDMREAVLSSWLKNVGDTIDKGDVVAEIESDKATLELEAQSGGTILEFMATEGDVIPVGGNLAIVGEEGEDISAMLEKSPDGDGAVLQQMEIDHSNGDSEQQPLPVAGTTSGDSPFPGGFKATPVARRIANTEGIDLSGVPGSGPGGRIRKVDVENHLASAITTAVPGTVGVVDSSGMLAEEIPTSRLRQAIGRRMVQSKTTAPHFYVTTEIDMGPALALRKEINALLPDEQKATVNDLIVKAAAVSLGDYPNLNASFAGDKVIHYKQINIGSAVAVEGGLLTVVQSNTDTSTLAQIASDNKSMVARARQGKSRPDDFEGVTFTVSNLGAYDVDHFIAIINPPNAAIVAVGAARQVPVVVEGELGVGWRMKATISADHRVTDGAEAAQFMQKLKETLEQPLKLLL